MNWYKGLILLEYLEELDIFGDLDDEVFCMLVQWVNWLNLNFWGYFGFVVLGIVCLGDVIVVVGLGIVVNVECVVMVDGDLDIVCVGDSVMLVFNYEIDILWGDVIVFVEQCLEVFDQFVVEVLWMNEEELLLGCFYFFKIGLVMMLVIVFVLKYWVDINIYEKQFSIKLEMNEIGMCNIVCMCLIVFDFYYQIWDMGVFIFVDCFINQIVGVGMICFGLCCVLNIYQYVMDVIKEQCVQIKG